MTTPATTPLTYNTYVLQLANMAVMATTTVNGVAQGVDATFNTLIPQALNYAELRIQRDLDVLPSVSSNTYTVFLGNNILQLGINDFVTVQTVSISANGTTNTLLPTTKEFIQNVYGGTLTANYGFPQYFAMVGSANGDFGNIYNNILLGPTPNNSYQAVVYGTTRLPTLYQNANASQASTATTFISTYYPDLLIQASMIYVSQFQRNFGAGSNDPSMGPTYELQYQNLLKGASVEEARKQFMSSEGTSYAPAPLVNTPRG
jgi:hypothetical protein